MKIRYDRVHVRVLALLLVVLLSACSKGGKGGGTGENGESPEDLSRLRVILCPSQGGEVRFLKLDSLELVRSGMEIPEETIAFTGALPSLRFAAVTARAVYLVHGDRDSAVDRIPVPELSRDLLVVPARETLFLVDRKNRRLLGIDVQQGEVRLNRTFDQVPGEASYFPGEGRFIMVLQRGSQGVVFALSPSKGASMTINLDQVHCSAAVPDEGVIVLATGEGETSRLEAFAVDNLSRVFQKAIDQEPTSMVSASEKGKTYLYFPEAKLVEAVSSDGGDVISEIPLESSGSGKLFADEAGRNLYLLDQRTGHVTVISTQRDLIVGEIDSHDGGTRLMTTPASRYILLQDSGGSRIRLYDGGTLELLRVIMEESPLVAGMVEGFEAGTGGVRVAEKKSAGPSQPLVPKGEKPAPSGDERELFILQVFSSDSLSSSKRVVYELTSEGFPAEVEEAIVGGRGTWYRVQVGRFTSREDAAAVGAHLRREYGFDTWTRTLGPREWKKRGVAGLSPGERDMDGDGNSEVTVFDSTGAVRLCSLREGLFVRRWRTHLPKGQVPCGKVAYMDRNGDGLLEVEISLCPDGGVYRIAWDGTGFTAAAG